MKFIKKILRKVYEMIKSFGIKVWTYVREIRPDYDLSKGRVNIFNKSTQDNLAFLVPPIDRANSKLSLKEIRIRCNTTIEPLYIEINPFPGSYGFALLIFGFGFILTLPYRTK